MVLKYKSAQAQRGRARTCDAVGADDGGQPVGDHDGGAPHHEAVQRALHQLLALAVQRARGLVQ